MNTEVKKLLIDFDNLKSKVQNNEDTIEGLLKIGCHPSVALYSLPHFLPQLMQEYQNLNLVLEHDLSRKITEAVISSRLDVGLAINPLAHPDLIIKKVTTDAVGFWQSPQSDDRILLADLDLNQTQALIKKLKKSMPQYERIVSCPNLEVIMELVSAGMGHGILPGRVAARSPAKLKQVPSSPQFQDELCLVYRSENRQSQKIKKFCDYAITHLR